MPDWHFPELRRWICYSQPKLIGSKYRKAVFFIYLFLFFKCNKPSGELLPQEGMINSWRGPELIQESCVFWHLCFVPSYCRIRWMASGLLGRGRSWAHWCLKDVYYLKFLMLLSLHRALSGIKKRSSSVIKPGTKGKEALLSFFSLPMLSV